MIFNTYYAEKEIERLMTRIPNFRPRGHGSYVFDLFEEVTGKRTTAAREPLCCPVCHFYGEVGKHQQAELWAKLGRFSGRCDEDEKLGQRGKSHILAQSKKRRKPLQYLKKTDLRLRQFWHE